MAQYVGVDVGSYAIKLAWMKPSLGKAELNLLESAYNPVGQFMPADEADKQKLAIVIKQLVTEHKLKGVPVRVALPESAAYSSVIAMPYLSDAELASSIHWEAEQHIPVPLEEVNLEYDVIYKPAKGDTGEKMRVLLVAAKKDMITQAVNLFKLADVEVGAIETSLLSIKRAMMATAQSRTACLICHMGALTTELMILTQGEMALTYVIQTGGLAMTRVLERALGLPAQQAEEYKRAYGLDQTKLEGKVAAALVSVVDIIVGEIRKALQFFSTSHANLPIQTMFLSGGGAYLPGLAPHLAQVLSTEVIMANPLENIAVKKDLTIPTNLGAFVPAIGMAMADD